MKRTAVIRTGISLIPIIVLIILLALNISFFGSDAILGASQVSLLFSAGICVWLAMWLFKKPWQDFEDAIRSNIGDVTTAIVILFLIGGISGTWTMSGTVPSMIYYGVKIISPKIFLLTACVICAFISVMIGSSWTTIATIGIALMGIGRAQGFDDGWIAGAIISGAYFGDKISPLSDTTVLASGSVNVPLFQHIRYMVITTLPSIVIASVVFFVVGLMFEGSDTGEIAAFSQALSGRFNITPWLLAVPVLTGIMIAKRWPPIITLFLSTLLAVVFALVFQSDVLGEIADGDLFKGAMQSVYGSTSIPTDSQLLTDLVATRGMAGMMGTIWLILCAMCFGGTMEAGGMVRGITQLFVRMIRGRTSLVGATACSGLMLNLAVADQYICVLLTGNMFKRIYDRQGYERRLLSRTTEDSVTVTSVLVPWNTCGMTQSTVLGVPTLTYLPYCIFNLVSPLVSICVATLGYKIFRVGEKKEQ